MYVQPSGAIHIEYYVIFFFKLGLNQITQRFTADKAM